jgi:hypothetical protein
MPRHQPLEAEMKGKHWTALAGAAAVMTIVAGMAMAQGPGGDDRGWWGGRWWHRGPDAMVERVEGRLAFIKAELKITEQQTAVWNELAEAVRNAAKHRNERMKDYHAGKVKTDTLLERLDAHEQVLSITLEDVKQIKLSANKLYTVLSDAQKKEADDIALPMMGFGRWGWHRWRD